MNSVLKLGEKHIFAPKNACFQWLFLRAKSPSIIMPIFFFSVMMVVLKKNKSGVQCRTFTLQKPDLIMHCRPRPLYIVISQKQLSADSFKHNSVKPAPILPKNR